MTTPTDAAVEAVTRAIVDGLGDWCSNTPDIDLSLFLRKQAAEYILARPDIFAAMPTPGEWQPIATAPRDGRYILAVYSCVDDGRHWNGRIFVIRHEGRTVSDYDLGWSLFPGHGGVPDAWFSGWMPAPPSDTSADATGSGGSDGGQQTQRART